MFHSLTKMPFFIALGRFILIMTVMFISACSVTSNNVVSDSDSKLLTPQQKEMFSSALSLMKEKNYKQAQSILINIIEKQPNFSNAHVNLGIIFSNEKSLIEAENSFQQALKINPENIYAFNQLGIVYRQQGKFSAAKIAYEKAISINSEYAFAHLNLGILYDLYLYNFPNAIEQYKTYQDLSKKKSKKINGWIIDLERRHKNSLAAK